MVLPQAAISFIVGGAFVWFVFCSDLSLRMSHHRIPFLRGLWFVAMLVALYWFMGRFIPYLHALV